jgi:predicted enzyme related to lactoylglutathione lyase
MLNPLHMMRKTALPLGLVLAFGAGYAFHSHHQQPLNSTTMKRVTGIGGIFFKCKNPQSLREWYQTHLGLETNEYGSVFEWYQGADSTKKGFTQWSPFKETTKYFEPSDREFMINYRVADLEALVEVLRSEGVTIVDSIETYDYGKFVHILDSEGNKIELWEPNDVVYEKMGIDMGAKTTK